MKPLFLLIFFGLISCSKKENNTITPISLLALNGTYDLYRIDFKSVGKDGKTSESKTPVGAMHYTFNSDGTFQTTIHCSLGEIRARTGTSSGTYSVNNTKLILGEFDAILRKPIPLNMLITSSTENELKLYFGLNEMKETYNGVVNPNTYEGRIINHWQTEYSTYDQTLVFKKK
jgi:hypothetical protein